MDESRSHLAVFGLVVAVIAVTFTVGYLKAPRLGLDLQGGLEVVLEAQPTRGETVSNDDINQSLEIIRDRVDSLGVAEPEIRPQGTNQIAIALPGVGDPERAAEVIGSTAQLQFYDLQENVVDSRVYRSAYDALRGARALVEEHGRGDLYMFDAKSHEQLAGPAPTRAELNERYEEREGEPPPKNVEVLAVPLEHRLLRDTSDGVAGSLGTEPERGEGRFDPELGVFLIMRDKPALDGSTIDIANPDTAGMGGGSGAWATAIQFNGEGADKFEEVTEKLAQRGRLRQSFQNFAIVLDDEIVSAPYIDYEDNPSGISGGNVQITGLESREEASDLALKLNTGSLPVRFEVVSRTEVSATLGRESLEQGLWAGAAGLLVVMIYMVLFYRFLGLIANISLATFALGLYAVVVGIPVVLTLPGIAGVILTIGVAADANIVIFERIRDEYRTGRSARAAVRNGFRRGITTIIDANVVTIITAGVLFLMGTSGVRGFALLLFIGILLSAVTAISTTYSILGLLMRVRFFARNWVIGSSRKVRNFQFNWMKWRRAFMIFNAVMMTIAISAVAVKGLNLGIDFSGGSKVNVVLNEGLTVEELRTALADVQPEYADASIQSRSTDVGASAFAFQVEELIASEEAADDLAADDANAGETRSEDEPEKPADPAALAQEQLEEALDTAYGVEAFSVQTIGPTFGSQVLLGAIIAVILSIFLEVLYIWARFEWKFTIPVVVSMLHDLMLCIGAYAFVGREFNATTVAALLTILGYSLYDVIIVFDRIRENSRLLRKSSWQHITTRSLNDVLTRSLNTSISTILPIVAIFFFGGETLTDFAFALMVGIGAGAYSSLIVAAPVLAYLKDREPKWAKRAGREDEEMAEYLEAVRVSRAAHDAASQEAPAETPMAGTRS